MIESMIRMDLHPLADSQYRRACRDRLDASGALVLRHFLTPDTLDNVIQEGNTQRPLAYSTASKHNVYLLKPDSTLSHYQPRNREVISTKGCITDEDVPADSPLRTLYTSALFKAFLCAVLGESALYPYADSLSSINLHYAQSGQELGWHFDNSSFAITLLLQKPLAGGTFQFVRDLRNADAGEMNYTGVNAVLDGQHPIESLAIDPGDLVLFRGRNSLHRVTPTVGEITRMLVVLAYNTQPDIALSETARMTFYGRL